jgi:hypothetical protein
VRSIRALRAVGFDEAGDARVIGRLAGGEVGIGTLCVGKAHAANAGGGVAMLRRGARAICVDAASARVALSDARGSARIRRAVGGIVTAASVGAEAFGAERARRAVGVAAASTEVSGLNTSAALRLEAAVRVLQAAEALLPRPVAHGALGIAADDGARRGSGIALWFRFRRAARGRRERGGDGESHSNELVHVVAPRRFGGVGSARPWHRCVAFVPCLSESDART